MRRKRKKKSRVWRDIAKAPVHRLAVVVMLALGTGLGLATAVAVQTGVTQMALAEAPQAQVLGVSTTAQVLHGQSCSAANSDDTQACLSYQLSKFNKTLSTWSGRLAYQLTGVTRGSVSLDGKVFVNRVKQSGWRTLSNLNAGQTYTAAFYSGFNASGTQVTSLDIVVPAAPAATVNQDGQQHRGDRNQQGDGHRRGKEDGQQGMMPRFVGQSGTGTPDASVGSSGTFPHLPPLPPLRGGDDSQQAISSGGQPPMTQQGGGGQPPPSQQSDDQ